MSAADPQPHSRLRINFWLTVCTVPALMMLVGLGTWQLERLEWKRNLIAERAAQLAEEPVSVADVPAGGWRDFDLRRVRLRGTFLHDRSIELLNRTWKGLPGVHIVTPVRLADGSGIVLVDRGWAPPKSQRTEAEMGLPGDPVEITGVLRIPGKTSSWVPDNEPGREQWFFADPQAIAAARGLEGVRSFIVEASADADRRYPVGGQTVTAIRNEHLQYALTWYGLAVALVVIYVLYHLRRRG